MSEKKLLTVPKALSFIFGGWSNGKRNIFQKIQVVVIFIISYINATTNMVNLLRCRGDLNCMMDTVTHLSVILGSIYLYTIYLLDEDIFKTAINHLGTLRDKYQTNHLTAKQERTVTIATAALYTDIVVGILVYIVVPIITYEHCVKTSNPLNDLDMFTCGLAMPAWFPFDVTTSPGYEVALVFQSFGATVAVLIFANPLFTSWSIILHVNAHWDMLQSTIEGIPKQPKQKRLEVLKHCIKYHNEIIDFINPVLATCNRLLFFNTCFIVVMLTSVGFEFIKIVMAGDYWNVCKYLFMLVGWMLILSGTSIVGQTLKDKSEQIMHCAYNIEWYNEPVVFQKMILLMMLRANRTVVLMNASLSENSYANFYQVMGSTYSYITVLLNYLD